MESLEQRCRKCGQRCIFRDTVYDEEDGKVKRLFICRCGQRFTVVKTKRARTDRASDTLEALEGVNRKLEELGLDEQ